MLVKYWSKSTINTNEYKNPILIGPNFQINLLHAWQIPTILAALFTSQKSLYEGKALFYSNHFQSLYLIMKFKLFHFCKSAYYVHHSYRLKWTFKRLTFPYIYV